MAIKILDFIGNRNEVLISRRAQIKKDMDATFAIVRQEIHPNKEMSPLKKLPYAHNQFTVFLLFNIFIRIDFSRFKDIKNEGNYNR